MSLSRPWCRGDRGIGARSRRETRSGGRIQLRQTESGDWEFGGLRIDLQAALRGRGLARHLHRGVRLRGVHQDPRGVGNWRFRVRHACPARSNDASRSRCRLRPIRRIRSSSAATPLSLRSQQLGQVIPDPTDTRWMSSDIWAAGPAPAGSQNVPVSDGMPASRREPWDGAACQVCQRRPARLIHLRRNVGMLTSREWHRVDMRLCRTHAGQGALYFLLLTLAFGWWGSISFWVNWGALAVDAAALPWGLVQRRAQGSPLANASFRQWYKTQKLLANLGRYVEAKQPQQGSLSLYQ